MNRLFAIYRLSVLVVAFALALVSYASAASWSAFGTAEFSGIALDKPLQVDVLEYTLTIGDKPTMTVRETTYRIDWVQSFYVVSESGGGIFDASNGSADQVWTWDSQVSDGRQIAGWTGQGNNRLYPGGSRTFEFATFDPKGNPLTTGFHVSYTDGKNTMTGWWRWKDHIQSAVVPEPSSMICFGVGAVSLIGLSLRRRRTSN